MQLRATRPPAKPSALPELPLVRLLYARDANAAAVGAAAVHSGAGTVARISGAAAVAAAPAGGR